MDIEKIIQLIKEFFKNEIDNIEPYIDASGIIHETDVQIDLILDMNKKLCEYIREATSD